MFAYPPILCKICCALCHTADVRRTGRDIVVTVISKVRLCASSIFRGFLLLPAGYIYDWRNLRVNRDGPEKRPLGGVKGGDLKKKKNTARSLAVNCRLGLGKKKPNKPPK